VGGTVCQVCSVGLDGRTPIGRPILSALHALLCRPPRRCGKALKGACVPHCSA
jgi:hypothetical protein